MLEVIDIAVQKAFDALGELPTVAAQKAHLDFLRDKYAHAERDIMNLQKENLDLIRVVSATKERLSVAEKKLDELTFQTVLADIGPCKVKVDNNRTVLPGYYCPECGIYMDRGHYSWGPDHLICQACKHIHVLGETADAARNTFIQRLQGSQKTSS